MLTDAASRPEKIASQPKRSYSPTLLDLVASLVDSGMNDFEVVQSVTRLLNSQRVRLIGQFRNPHLEVAQGRTVQGPRL